MRKLFAYYLLASITPLMVVYVAEHGFGVHPCRLCIYQRILLWVASALCSLAIFIKSPYIRRYIYWALGATAITNLGVAIFHVALEHRLVTFDSPCFLDPRSFLDLAAYKEALDKADLVSCAAPVPTPLGVSMSTLSMLFTAAYASILFYTRSISKIWRTSGEED